MTLKSGNFCTADNETRLKVSGLGSQNKLSGCEIEIIYVGGHILLDVDMAMSYKLKVN
uniref:Uncharacterized protein n=1 Tax=Arion vulgaris TaxID=1028688 RepID=A0A0B7AL14_9EUPU